MPSLLSRFLGKKKNADQSPLLDGEKFEAVPRTTSPSVPTFGDSAHRTKSKEKEHDKGQGKRPKRSSAGIYDTQLAESVPVLSLSITDTKDEEKKSQGLGVVFEGITDGPKTLDDEALGEKRLSPSETLVLVQKTSEVLSERGLEMLGVMRPHWFASPRQQEIQLKLIHRFLATLDSPKSNSTSSPSPQSAFESELRYSRDPHDVAAVLRWGLRHLQLEGKSFGSSGTEDWYRTFADSERSSSYPIKAFDDILVPLLPTPHTHLLRATMDMVSSLAAHSEENGISGNKLSKVLGWWVVSSRNIQGSRWPEFYAQWEAAARQFEHLFLAYIRAQDAQSRMPKRLTELVKNYPFAKNRREEDGIYLPRSRFSTRSADALFVQVTVDKSVVSSRPHPLRILEDAFRATAQGEPTGVYAAFWEELRKLASAQLAGKSREEDADQVDSPLDLTKILADESVRLFSLVPALDDAAAPTLSLFTPLPAGRGRRSLSVGERSPTSHTANGRAQSVTRESTSHSKAATSPQSSSQGHDVTPDWQAFSSSGFNSPSGLSLAASLWDNDTEVSQPTPKKATMISKRNSKSGAPRRRSADQPASTRPTVDTAKPARRTYATPCMVTLDEAFIDFWADSLLDSIARTWPTFVVCQLKPLSALTRAEDRKPIEWLIIERVTDEPVRQTPPPIKTSSTSPRAASPLPSPTTSDGSKSNRWASSTLAATRKRFSFFSSRNESAPAAPGGRDRAVKKAAKDAKVGEMGEILKEEDESAPNGVKTDDGHKPETPKKSAERPQQPPMIQVNGVSKSEESPSVESSAASESAGAERSSKPGLSPIEEIDVPKQSPDPTRQESVQPSQPRPVTEESTGEQPTVEKAQPDAPTSHEVAVLPEVPVMPPVPSAPPPVVLESRSTPDETSPPPEAAPVSVQPSEEPAREVAPVIQAAASTVEETPSAAAAEPVTLVEQADDIPATTVEATEPAEAAAPQPQVEIPPSTEVVSDHESVKELVAPAPAEVAQHEHELEPTVQIPVKVSPEAQAFETSSVPETIPEEPSTITDQPEEEVVSSQLATPAAEPPTSGPYVHHATIYIPPADENDLAQMRMPAVAEHDDVESSDAAPEESAESSHPPLPSEPELAPHHSPQEPANGDPVPAVVTEDAAKVDDVRPEASTEETQPEERPSEATP